MSLKGIGIDVVEVEKLSKFKTKSTHPFITKNFSTAERTYCYDFRNPVPHFAGIFAAKEAVRKTLSGSKILLSSIEIKHNQHGKPIAYRNHKKIHSMFLSITHTDSIAIAIAIQV